MRTFEIEWADLALGERSTVVAAHGLQRNLYVSDELRHVERGEVPFDDIVRHIAGLAQRAQSGSAVEDVLIRERGRRVDAVDDDVRTGTRQQRTERGSFHYIIRQFAVQIVEQHATRRGIGEDVLARTLTLVVALEQIPPRSLDARCRVSCRLAFQLRNCRLSLGPRQPEAAVRPGTASAFSAVRGG